MATTRLIPIRGSRGQSVIRSLTERMDYVKNPEKTENGSLVYARGCSPQLAAAEFALSKRQYAQCTGRREPGVIAYHIRQSFKPGEITPEEANLVGRDLAERFLKGRHACIVCTHTDKRHIHNHIIFNSTTLDGTAKFRDFLGSGRALGRLSDLICIEHGLSVIQNPRRYTHSTYDKWLGEKKPASHRDILRADIDAVLTEKPKDFEELLDRLRQTGWEVSAGAHVTFRKSGQRAIRLRSLGEGYSEAELRAAIAGHAAHLPRGKRERTSLVIDIEAKLAEGKGAGYERWAKVFNVKQMAKTLLYLQEHGISSRAELMARTDAVGEQLADVRKRIKAAEARIDEVAQLRKQIVSYAGTREVFAAYKAGGYSREFYNKHEADIEKHREAKRYFNDHGLKKLPKVKDLNAEFNALVAEKRAAYAEYRALRDGQRELLIHRQNVESLLSDNKTEQNRRIRGER